jgi:two-component system response regulator FixJ
MADGPNVHIVDDDEAIRDSVEAILRGAGIACASYPSAHDFLTSPLSLEPGCALIDVRMPQMDGLALLQELRARGSSISVIIMTGFADVPLAVKAMKAGAVDFVEKPSPRKELVAAVERALAATKAVSAGSDEKKAAQARLERLTERERDVLELLVAGDANKVVAHKLGISPRTVEIHRGRLMEKTQVKSLAELVRVALAAGVGRKDG